MFHGLFGNAEALGYLLIFHVVALAHEEDLPAFVGQAVFFLCQYLSIFLVSVELESK